MEQLPPATSLLEELDRRQDEVLAQLDELEERLTRILAEYTVVRPSAPTIHPLDVPARREAA